MSESITIIQPQEAYALWAPHYPARAHNPVMQAEERAMITLMPLHLDGCSVVDAGYGDARTQAVPLVTVWA
jgi:malonyl-CoA O-methyltransferase